MPERPHDHDEHDDDFRFKIHIHHHFHHFHHFHRRWMWDLPELEATQFPLPPACPEGRLHVVQAGETLSGLSRQFAVPLTTIIAANPQITNPDAIFPGQTVCIPLPGHGFPPGTPPPPGTCSGQLYEVQRGDTFFSIARRFNVTLTALVAANPQVIDPGSILVGQLICVPTTGAPPTPPPPSCPQGNLVTVMGGDTLFAIAQRNGVTVQAIINANPQLTDPNQIFPGQLLCVPRPT